MTRFLFVFCSLWLMSFGTQAASFDCTKAKHPVEIAICDNDELSRLDNQLANVFETRQEFIIKGDSSLIDEQKQWLKEMRAECAATIEPDNCVRGQYQGRIKQLLSIPSSPLHLWKAEKFVRITDILSDYDFELMLEPSFYCDYDACMDDRRLAIYAKGSKNIRQIIDLPAVGFLPGDNDNEILSRMGSKLYFKDLTDQNDYNVVFEVHDYNLDGYPDFAVFTGHRSVKGARESWIFLYDPDDGKFYYAPSFSDVLYAMLVDYDEEARKIITFHKPSCCSSVTITYKIVQNVPVPIKKFTYDMMEEDGFAISIKEIWRDGKWQEVSREREALEE